MLKNPFLPIVPVIPLPSKPFLPIPSSLIISLATDLNEKKKSLDISDFSYQVEGVLDWWDLFDCILTLTTSKGFTIMASVTPDPSPASEYVWS